MKIATTCIYIDSYHPNKDGECRISIRVTYARQKKYYATGVMLTKQGFENVMLAKRRDEEEKKTFIKLQAFLAKANSVIEKLEIFTFPLFEKMYLRHRGAVNTVSLAFEDYITFLKSEDRVGTAASYEAAKLSFENFKPGLKFADISPALLRSYEAWMYQKEKSPTTVGFYVRALRTMFNQAEIDRALYPFSGKDKYKIPAGRNIKKALTLDEVGKIYHAEIKAGTTREMARDYWMFIYLCNGINMKDLCLLKYKNIDGDFIKFERSKTENTKKEFSVISISLKADAKKIIEKWGQKSLNLDTYIFPHLQKGLSADRQRQLIQQLTRVVNDHISALAKELKISKHVTSYVARHTFSTVLKRSGASMEFISEALGHSDLKTTRAYLDSFEDDTVKDVTEALTAFKTSKTDESGMAAS